MSQWQKAWPAEKLFNYCALGLEVSLLVGKTHVFLLKTCFFLKKSQLVIYENLSYLREKRLFPRKSYVCCTKANVFSRNASSFLGKANSTSYAGGTARPPLGGETVAYRWPE